jgi:5'(3')-deoxyribonucleotidase
MGLRVNLCGRECAVCADPLIADKINQLSFFLGT